ncbi:MAG: hypothetical protein ACYCSS_10550 [Sulfuriferula sp.]
MSAAPKWQFDYGEDRPAFAVESGLAALRWVALRYGYDITGMDVLSAYSAIMQAAPKS